MSQFTHLHVHTQYSILDGASAIKSLMDRAVELGMTSIAITDHGNMFGVKEFHNAATKAGIKPILGCEVYVASKSRFDKSDKDDRGGDHLILLAKNEEGYHNLIKLVSYSWTEGFYYKPRVDMELLEKYSKGIVCCSACLGGELPQAIMNGTMEDAEAVIAKFKKIFGDDYYLEMQSHRSGDKGIDEQVYEHQIGVNKAILELAKKTNTKYIVSNDVHFIRAEDAKAHDHLICLNTGKDLDDPNRMRYTTQEYLKSYDEMLQMFPDNPEALETTNEIASKIEEYTLSHKPFMPHFHLPEDFIIDPESLKRSLYKKIENKDIHADFEAITDVNGINSLVEAKYPELCELLIISKQQKYLEYITYEGLKRRYPDITPEIKERTDFELSTIEWMGFPGYFLIVWDFIRAAREMDVSVGPGRGSAAGSVVAYCLGITNIDPVKYDLLFERFLNPERISMPDVDIDFDEDGREAVLKYVVNKYGQKRVAHIITFGTMAAKMAIRDIARVQKLPLAEAMNLAKLVPDKPGTTLKKAFAEVPELSEARTSPNPLVCDTLKYAEALEGSVRQTGIHACGVIIAQDDLENFIPVATAKDAELYVVQYEGTLVEDVGLLKMDFLGLKTLSIIKDAVENVEISQNITVDIDSIPLDDCKTFDLYSKGETTGIFQFESPGMKKHLRSLKPNRFEDLIAMNALYRPGPMEYIPDYIARKHGHQKVEYDLPDMELYLKDTYGITVYQEQVMLLSQQLAGFTKGQADALRKAMGKKLRAVLDKMKPQFIEGAAKNGHDAKICEKIWTDWEAFASYAFNKSHSTCYAYVSYQTAYLKAHYPAEFMAALLSRNLSDISKISFFMDECKRMGMSVLGPDVNKSLHKFSVDTESNVRFGLGAVKGVGEAAVQNIIEERKNGGPFKDIFDFVERVNLQAVNKKTLENLVLAGAFDSFINFPRCRFFATDIRGVQFLESLVRYGSRMQSDKVNSQQSLFDGFIEDVAVQKPELPDSEDWSKLETLNKERDVVGIYLSSHPLDDHRVVIEKYCSNTISELDNLADLNGRDFVIGGMITSVKHLMTQKGQAYCRFTIEDFSGSFEFTLWRKDYENFRNFCYDQNLVLVRGRVQNRFHTPELEAAILSIKSLHDVLDNDINELTLTIPIYEMTGDFINDFSAVVQSSEGRVNLALKVIDAESGVYSTLRSRKYKVALNKNLIGVIDDYGLEYRIH